MSLAILLAALTWGSPHMSFPWWVWLAAWVCDMAPLSVKVTNKVSP